MPAQATSAAAAVEAVSLPPELSAQLFPHQQRTVQWMRTLEARQAYGRAAPLECLPALQETMADVQVAMPAGGVIGHPMGSGKTRIVLALAAMDVTRADVPPPSAPPLAPAIAASSSASFSASAGSSLTAANATATVTAAVAPGTAATAAAAAAAAAASAASAASATSAGTAATAAATAPGSAGPAGSAAAGSSSEHAAHPSPPPPPPRWSTTLVLCPSHLTDQWRQEAVALPAAAGRVLVCGFHAISHDLP